ncbi:hypothetical protein HYC85_014001 [Camellia sinensis]|uniref:Uncharacterized protein n=1 Tax=Camellia sinensis TaxID=4442 RepID=A0A7J7H867_CAMSI|nr:hypothetical protein HYC85_014001 [Camellia sinensis]
MSTDLEFQQGLAQLRLPTIRIKPSADEIPTIQTPKSGSNSNSGDDECRTPTSPEHKIPAMLSCPPAPKKPRRTEHYKRKLCELQFFEIVGISSLSQDLNKLFGDLKARVSEQMGEIRSVVEMAQLEAEKKHDEVVDEMLAMLNAKAEASRLKEVEQEVGKDVDEEQ